MSQDWYQDIVDFHREVQQEDVKICPHIPVDRSITLLREDLIEEEINETIEGLVADDLVKIADGIVDSIVVLIGTAIAYGIDLRPIWDEVHKTNMAKKGGPLRKDGKRLKPEGWKPPQIAEILKRQQKGEK